MLQKIIFSIILLGAFVASKSNTNINLISDSIKVAEHEKVDSLLDAFDKSSHFEIGLDFSSKVYYWGRTFGINGAVFSPTLYYQHKSGVFTSLYTTQYTSPKFKKFPIPEIDLTIGFDRTFFDYWHIQTYYDHNFVQYGTKASRNLLSNSWSLNSSFDFFDYLNLEVESYLMWGGIHTKKISKNVLSEVLSFRLSKDFRIYHFLGAKVFSITPIVLVDIGDNNFASSFANRYNGIDSVFVSTNKQMKLLNFEASIDFNYRIKNFQAFVTPKISTPFNTNNTQSNKMNPPVFYVNAGVKYLFRINK